MVTFHWLSLAAYGALLFAIAPRAATSTGFLWGRDARGAVPSAALLTGSVLVTWIFAKSITNAANLGEKFGILGGLAYGAWYLSIPVAGLLIYWIRRHGHEGLVPFLVARFGRTAAILFSVTILIRLFNEIWSNTAVVAGYFGPPGTTGYYAGAFGFTGAVLLYSLRGGLRGSIFTDRLQLALAVVLLGWVLAWVVPGNGTRPLVMSSNWSLAGGLDLLLVGVLQATSYPFHDPVLTDRGFVTPPRRMLFAYAAAGVLGIAFITLYGLLGVHARLQGLGGAGDAPVRVAAALHGGALLVVAILMMNSAGAVLDSAFAAIARHVSVDLAGQGGAHPAGFSGLWAPLRRFAAEDGGVRLGRWTMVGFAAIGNLPLFLGADILQATTISGTMVLGLAPPFLLWRWHKPAPLAFILSFAVGLATGITVAAGAWPASLGAGSGKYAGLLGANIFGLGASFAAYAFGLAWERVRRAMGSLDRRVRSLDA